MSTRNTRSFNELKRDVEARPGARQRLERYRRELARELTLAELRRAVELTQSQLADVLDMTQPGISRVERQTDLYLSTLRSYVEALGGELELRVVFPESSISLPRLSEIETEADDPPLDDPPVRVSVVQGKPTLFSMFWNKMGDDSSFVPAIQGICKYDIDVAFGYDFAKRSGPKPAKRLLDRTYLKVIDADHDQIFWRSRSESSRS